MPCSETEQDSELAIDQYVWVFYGWGDVQVLVQMLQSAMPAC